MLLTDRAEVHRALQDAERVYADVECLVDMTREAAPDASIRTFSPAVSAPKAYDVLPADHIRKAEAAGAELGERIREKYWNSAPDLATALVNESYDRLHRLLYKAICLEEDDFTRKTVLLQPGDPDDPVFNDTFASPLERIFENSPNVRVARLSRSLLPDAVDPRPPNPRLLTRLAFSSIQSILFRLIEEFWQRSSVRGPRGMIAILRDNELVKETGFWLALRGFGVARIVIPTPVLEPTEPERPMPVDLEELGRFAEEQFRLCFEKIMHPLACDVLAQLYSQDCKAITRSYSQMTRAWSKALNGPGQKLPAAVLTNIVGGVELAALHHVLRPSNVPLCLFQHGVTMEYHNTHELYGAAHETAFSDLAVLFNAKGVAVAERSSFKQGAAIAVGLPHEYTTQARRRTKPNQSPIWYISTALYLGNRGALFEGVHDGMKCAFETMLIKDIFGELPHGVVYKPYPGRRFLDQLPEEDAVNAADNVIYMRERIDMRYLFDRARILVTARSFSTPSWCIMSGRPVVYIDSPGQASLTQEAREAFTAGVFFFNAEEPHFTRDLRVFLSQSIENIEQQYRAKAAARETLIDTYITNNSDCRAGRRAARAIMDRIRRNKSV